ncbi:hypothetical protein L3Q72_12385 [Vibrio sp. JC009]|uniref:hypothetical protein n=1 Tax=Vibrio sp. JC009 TaxID=2912314 RepID=UPI0023AFBE69|nr:hypothetical protein [Vibrio sp. JC009]WED21419.1 hypothetical protein L3Q72_12385 [Vibrio sp. JC009]
MKVSLSDLEMAVEFVSGPPSITAEAFVDKEKGRVYLAGECVEEEPPEDLYVNDRYIEVPSKTDLDLGRSVALKFASTPTHKF